MKIARQLVSLGAAAALSAGALEAQAPRHEFGVDMGIASTKFDGGDGRVLQVGMPIDVRVGFVTATPLMFETRFNLSYVGTDDFSLLTFAPGVNALWRLGPGTGMANQMGPYLTGGVSLEYARFSNDFDDESESATQFGINVGVGTRLGWGTAAFRPELFFAQNFESGDEEDLDYAPANSTIGLRLGISLWR